LSFEALRDGAFQAIKRYEGCDDVSDVTIYEIKSDRVQCNWTIGSIAIGSGAANAENLAAVFVEQELRNDFDLLTAL
jgi:hypothetical protein